LDSVAIGVITWAHLSHDNECLYVVATASTCNVVLMRYNELSEGIEVTDANQQVIGTSQAAGWKVCALACPAVKIRLNSVY